MGKTFKVVCINCNTRDGYESTFLHTGKIYDACCIVDGKAQVNWNICTQGCNENYWYSKTYFLRIPTEPKTCADMTMEEYLAMVCLRNFSPTEVEYYNGHKRGFKPVAGDYMPYKNSLSETLYRIKPEKSAKDIEIEAIEAEMRKLADRLKKVKGS